MGGRWRQRLGEPDERRPSRRESSSDGTVLKAPAGTDAATIAAAAEVVRGRLGRMGVTNAAVSSTSDGVAVKSSADGYQLDGAAQRHATTIAPVAGTTVGCSAPS